MSQNVPKLRQAKRLEYIEKNILFKTQEEMAKELKVGRKTIQRDIDKWRKSGGFQRFLIKEFFELYGKERLENPSLALSRVMTLLMKEDMRPEAYAPKGLKKKIEQIISFSRAKNAATKPGNPGS